MQRDQRLSIMLAKNARADRYTYVYCAAILLLMLFDFHSMLRLPVSLHLYEGLVSLLAIFGSIIFRRAGLPLHVFTAAIVACCFYIICTHPMCRDPWFCRAERVEARRGEIVDEVRPLRREGTRWA